MEFREIAVVQVETGRGKAVERPGNQPDVSVSVEEEMLEYEPMKRA